MRLEKWLLGAGNQGKRREYSAATSHREHQTIHLVQALFLSKKGTTQLRIIFKRIEKLE
ncbi:MAG: hypothetical protein Q4G68_09860 [Planctomycetia bacterium]|nr:hypothetical protein [Planctomycetia bacterium]